MLHVLFIHWFVLPNCKSSSMYKSEWSQDHTNLQKMYIYTLTKIYIYIYIYTKLTYFDHLNINVYHPDLIIITHKNLGSIKIRVILS